MARIKGHNYDDYLLGNARGDSIFGLGGNDYLSGGNGNDRLSGGRGNDQLLGDGGNDLLKGGTGADAIFGGAGNDNLRGDAGNDILSGGGGYDRLSGGAGLDTAVFTGSLSEYDFSANAGGFVIRHVRGSAADGVDFLDRSVELLQFANASPVNMNSSGPSAGTDSLTVDEDSAAFGTSVLDNDFDLQAKLGLETLTVSQVNGLALVNGGLTITLASGAEVSIQANGSYSYDPNGAFEGLNSGQTAIDSFTYQVSDGNGGTAAGTVNVTINGSNDAPVVQVTQNVLLSVLNLLSVPINPNVIISDVDDALISGAQVLISNGFQAGDALLFNAASGITGVFDSVTHMLTLAGDATLAAYETALESVVFKPGSVLLLGQRDITIAINDGHVLSVPNALATIDLDVIL